jgi:hypothetical protein
VSTQPNLTQEFDDYVRSGRMVQALPLSSASTSAQGDRGGGTVGIENIRRAHAPLVTKTTSDISVTITSAWQKLSSELDVQSAFSGRPCIAACTVVAYAPLNPLYLSLIVDGAEVTGRSGIIQATVPYFVPLSFVWPFTPAAGTHTVALVAKVGGGTATVRTSLHPATLIITEQ